MKIKCACGNKNCQNAIWNEGTNRLFVRKGDIVNGTDTLVYLKDKTILALIVMLAGMVIMNRVNKLNEMLKLGGRIL